MLRLLARRAAESNAFSVPERNALWRRVEDDLLVQAVGMMMMMMMMLYLFKEFSKES
jgi:hypothetical protein